MGRVPASLLLHLLSESPYVYLHTRTCTGAVHARERAYAEMVFEHRRCSILVRTYDNNIAVLQARIHGGQDRKRQVMHGTQHLIRYAARGGGSSRIARRGVESFLLPAIRYRVYPLTFTIDIPIIFRRLSGSLSPIPICNAKNYARCDKTRIFSFSICSTRSRFRDSKGKIGSSWIAIGISANGIRRHWMRQTD